MAGLERLVSTESARRIRARTADRCHRAVALLAFPGWRAAQRARHPRRGERHAQLVASARLVNSPAVARPSTAPTWRSSRRRAGRGDRGRASIKAPRRSRRFAADTRVRATLAVYYLAADGPARAVGRAIDESRAQDRITVLPLSDAPRSARERGGGR